MMIFRGDHIVPSFEEIWPSRGPTKRVKRGIEYYLDVCDDDVDVNDDKQGPHQRGASSTILLYTDIFTDDDDNPPSK